MCSIQKCVKICELCMRTCIYKKEYYLRHSGLTSMREGLPSLSYRLRALFAESPQYALVGSILLENWTPPHFLFLRLFRF